MSCDSPDLSGNLLDSGLTTALKKKLLSLILKFRIIFNCAQKSISYWNRPHLIQTFTGSKSIQLTYSFATWPTTASNSANDINYNHHFGLFIYLSENETAQNNE